VQTANSHLALKKLSSNVPTIIELVFRLSGRVKNHSSIFFHFIFITHAMHSHLGKKLASAAKGAGHFQTAVTTPPVINKKA